MVLCKVKYKPISGHYTTSELTNSLAQDDRILIWYAPLRDTRLFHPLSRAADHLDGRSQHGADSLN